MLHQTLPLGVRLDQCFSWMAALAQSLPVERRTSALMILQKLIAQLGETEITVNVPIDSVICHTCDELRAKGRIEEVRIVEELVQVLKAGEHRVIQGGFQLNARNLADVDGQLEVLRQVLVAGR